MAIIRNQALFGIINVDKPKTFTSHDVVAKIRRILKIKQVGHTGTLDPMATGVLPVCIGKATKIIQYLEGSKAYRAYIKLGTVTDTYDLEGEIVSVKPVDYDEEKVREALTKFQGEILQKPPMHSAVHYKGKRLYEYARANIEIEDVPERKVVINSINLVDVLDKGSASPVIIVDVDCASGTYIRSIANDLGSMLGYGATLADLVRTRAGKFTLDTSHSLEEIEEFYKNGRIDEILIDPVCVINLRCCKIDADQVTKISQGQYIQNIYGNEVQNKERIQLIFEDKLIGIAEIRDDKVFPVNVFI